VMRMSAQSRLSTRRHYAASEHKREGEMPACSCHAGVQPRGMVPTGTA
jgi:hypothetical protein